MLNEPEIIIGLVLKCATAHISADLSQEVSSIFYVSGTFLQAFKDRLSIAFKIVRIAWFWPSVLSILSCALQYLCHPPHHHVTSPPYC
jgi:hypothetical protein